MKALILGTYTDPPYHPFHEVDLLLKSLLPGGWEAECTEDLQALLHLDGIDLLISYLDAFDETLPPACGEAVIRYLREGGRLLCLHNGISLQTDPDLYQILGGGFTHHPPQEILTFLPEDFLEDCPCFALLEEPYQFRLSGAELTPVLRYRYREQWYPGGWRRQEGKGELVFLTPGHSLASFRVPEFQLLIRRSIEHLCGKKA